MKINSLVLFITLLALLVDTPSMAQNLSESDARLIGRCEGCEAVFEYGDRTLTHTDTLPGFEETEPKLKITGTIYESDGVTPAEGVILYVYQTNREGVYPAGEEGWARQHGYIRGWMKTGADGRYTFYTFRPGSYSSNPAHIHPIILEPDGRYYWLGGYEFADDPLLSKEERESESPRGGSTGILSLTKQDGIWVGHRDIILGRNVPGYE